jgi:hypothetical protein
MEQSWMNDSFGQTLIKALLKVRQSLDRSFESFLFILLFIPIPIQIGRQFGRGRNGGQVRDEYRTNYDKDRGGYGHMIRLEKTRREEQEKSYEPITSIPTGASNNTTITPVKPVSSQKMNEEEEEFDA